MKRLMQMATYYEDTNRIAIAMWMSGEGRSQVSTTVWMTVKEARALAKELDSELDKAAAKEMQNVLEGA
mgnify:CR=1 FL=1